MRGALLSLFFVLLTWAASAQERMSADQYIQTYSGLAVSEMLRVGVPASITLAQGLVESAAGNSRLSTEGKNHFGIKCKRQLDRKEDIPG